MKKKRIVTAAIAVFFTIGLTGCALFDSEVNELNGSINGNAYDIGFYSNEGENFMNMTGENINMSSNTVKEPVYSDGSWGYTEAMSSVVTVTIDGKEVESCGSTMIFAEDDLKPEVDFQSPELIQSESDGSLTDYTFIAGIVNKVRNNFGKSRVVVIQSQLGNPICAYSGDEVYWKVCQDLPKTTKLMIDGKALYIHRANFQIIDKDLLN